MKKFKGNFKSYGRREKVWAICAGSSNLEEGYFDTYYNKD